MPDTPLRIVIVGGVAGGATAAARARRVHEHAEITLLEAGADISFANCGLPYYLGGEIADRGKLLVTTAEAMRQRYRIHVRPRHRVTAVDRDNRIVRGVHVEDGDLFEVPYDRLILATGASPIMPPIDGIDADGVFSLRDLADTDAIHDWLASHGSAAVAVIGAGYIGLEMAEQLRRRGFEVDLVEKLPQVLPLLDREMAQPLHDELVRHGVRVHTGDGIAAIEADGSGVTAVTLESGRQLAVGTVIMGIGVRPNTALAAAAGLEMGPTGGVKVNRFHQTSDPDIYAVGDMVEYPYGPTDGWQRVPLAGPANRAGRLAGTHAAGGKPYTMADVMGTSIVRVFDMTAALTGLTARAAERAGIDARAVTIDAKHHAGYYPGAEQLTLKLLYAPHDGRVLGAQVVGKAGVDKRVDVIATAMHFGGTVRDLAGLDLAYAPPFGSAKDPVHIAGFAAGNELDEMVSVVQADADLTGKQVLDVRSADEVRSRPLPAAEPVNVPLDELRDRLGELDQDRETVCSCGSGQRSYNACRILMQRGFGQVANLSGAVTQRERAFPKETRDEQQ